MKISHDRPESWGLSLVLVVLLASPASGQGIEVESPQLREGLHTVRPGDTLENITAHYLGTSERWRENWLLNPEVEDPDRIYPGQRLRVLLEEELPADGALLFKKSRQVEDQLLPYDWREAEKNDLLQPLDQLRTLQASSAELLFFDNTHLVLTEQSLVILGEAEQAAPEVDRAQIEILMGQADLAGTSASAGSQEIEIVLGEATAKPRANADGEIATRARRPQGGGAQVMSYRGESEVEAAGAQVTVPQGMGSSVPEGEPPKPPEKLLPGPADLDPAAGARLATPRPSFAWGVVAGASAYTVEVCRDAACGELVERVTGLGEPGWQPAKLPVAELFWRVTAVSASGLDGYPSAATRFTVLTDAEDAEPPQVAVRFTGPHIAPRSGIHDHWIVGPGFAIEVEVEDATGVREWTPVLDGESVAEDALRGRWTAGEHTVAVVAVDEAGNRTETDPISFVYDPDPPRFYWGLEGSGDKRLVPPALAAELTGPAPARRDRQRIEVGRQRWYLESDAAQILIWPTRKRVRPQGVDQDLSRSLGLWILAEDEACPDPGDLTYDVVGLGSAGDSILIVEAVDCIGNRARITWPLNRSDS